MEEQEEALPKRCYTKGEIAAAVGLNIRYLWREIHANKSLMEALRRAGYANKRARILTVRQSMIVLNHYGCCDIDGLIGEK